MTLRKIYTVHNNQVVVDLPAGFRSSKRVMVTVEDEKFASRKKKMDLLKKAADDPLFLKDVQDIASDFGPIDHESL